MRYLRCLYGICLTAVLIFSAFCYAQGIEYPQDNYNIRSPFKTQIPEPKPQQPVTEIKPQEEESGVVALPRFNVQGMVWQGANPLAIINNRVLKVGDTLNDAKVVNVSKDGVDFLYQGRVFTI